ncbi:MAG: type II secretion system F family protein [Acidimicrobiales bacterium]
MTVRLLLMLSGVFWLGLTLILAEVRVFSRRSLADRLTPYVPGGMARSGSSGLFSVGSFREVVAPLSREVGERVARLFGVNEDLAVRLERIHSPLGSTEYRVQQIGWSVVSLVFALIITMALTPPLPLVALLLLGGPMLAFLWLEQRIASASKQWQNRVFLELPVIAEQLGLLLGSGYSLGGAISRLADRGDGACALDLQRVRLRTRQGLSEVQALREWSALAGAPAVDRLVSILALNSDASDLGRLVSEEARSIRRDAQRQLIEMIERRTQQVWIPVTLATLIPGVMLMLVPFISALSLFSGS